MTYPSVISTDNSRKVSPLPKDLDRLRMPDHIAVIMDGNGRWAKEKGKSRIYGHLQGVKSVKQIVKSAIELDVKYLTLFAFSKENWQRPKNEVSMLMDLFCLLYTSPSPRDS